MGFGLTEEEVSNLKVDKYIVDRIVTALKQLKQCRNEEERSHYHIVLGALAPTREASRDIHGMIRSVSTRLGVARGARYVHGEKRPYVFDQAIERRTQFDEAAASHSKPLKPGDAATSRGRPCVVLEIDEEADKCTLSLSSGGMQAIREYNCIYKGTNAPGKTPFPPGSARLRRAPPTLQPPPRETRCDEKAEVTRAKVEELFNAEGARSPSQHDIMRRQLSYGIYETAQALIVFARYSALYNLFCSRYPAFQISFSTFKRLRPWYVKRAKEESCLCKHCDNFKQQQVTLHSLAVILQALVDVPPTVDAEDAPDDDEDASDVSRWEGKSALRRLLHFCSLNSKSDMVRFMLCNGAFDGAGKDACINGTCSLCGFGTLWSKGLRPHIVDNNGDLKSSLPVEFQTIVKWIRIQSCKHTTPGEASETRYDERHGTVVQFLDEFERETIRKFAHHRFTLQRQKATDAEFDRNSWPGWLQFNIDFAMDGTIPPPEGRSMQTDHWSPMSYTLFVNIVSWLRTDKWVDRSSSLPRGAFVTVEPGEASIVNATEPAEGSYWAEVVGLPRICSTNEVSQVDPGALVYTVRRHGSSSDDPLEEIERRFLRHREKHTKAFCHISDDKMHDSYAAQKFISSVLENLYENYVRTGQEAFVGLRMHSDNAPTHFKNSKTMYFLSTLPERLKTWTVGNGTRNLRVVWEFGPPGHGKGVWDGIGAWMKRTVRQDVVDHHPPSMPTILTSDGRILSPRQVAEHLKVRIGEGHETRLWACKM